MKKKSPTDDARIMFSVKLAGLSTQQKRKRLESVATALGFALRYDARDGSGRDISGVTIVDKSGIIIGYGETLLTAWGWLLGYARGITGYILSAGNSDEAA